MSGERITEDHAQELVECFATWAPELFGYACVLTRGDRALADDFVQFTFIAVARQWPTARCLDQAQRRSWLRTTVGNLAVSAFGRNEAFRDRLPQHEALYRPSLADTHAEALLDISLERWWQLIQGLPQQQHAVAAMRWLLGMNNSEIAATLGIADEIVAAHVSVVRGKLKAGTEPYDSLEGDEEGTFVTTTIGNDPANTHEDELLVHLYRQGTDRQAARYANAYAAEAGLTRFNAWLEERSPADAVATATRAGTDAVRVPVRPGNVIETSVTTGAIVPDSFMTSATASTEWSADRAFTELYSTHHRALVRLAALLVRDIPTAEDVVQDSFIAMRDGWDQLRDAQKALAYLRQAVVSRSRAILRNRIVMDDVPKLAPDMPSAELEALLERSVVVAALRRLPDRQREAIVLRLYADLREAEIAAAMGISRGAVKSLTARGMSALRAAIAAETDNRS